jgi:hypothetical protein
MLKPVSEWTEDYILALPQDENGTFERKGSKLLDLTLAGVKEGHVLDELAKQLSAFANTGPGQIIYGLTNAGTVDDGGVSRSIRGNQSTKEWLEDVIPTLTDFEIVGFNVYEPPKSVASSLAPDKSIYVVDVPLSDRAPHQSKRDLKYYVRLAGKSHPASHRLIEDIRNRAQHPKLEVHDMHVINAVPVAPKPSEFASEFTLNLGLRFGLRNVGKVRALNTCMQLSATTPITANIGGGEYNLRSGSPGTALLEFSNPFYPRMGVMTSCPIQVAAATVTLSSLGESLTLGGSSPDDFSFSVTIFSDNAPPQQQEFTLTDIDSDRTLVRVIAQSVNHIRNFRYEGRPSQRNTPWS